MSTAVSTSPRRTSIATRVGLVIAVLLSVGDIVSAIGQLAESAVDPIAWFMLLAGVATLVAIPFAWRGSVRAGWTVAIVRVVASLAGVPAFFVPGVPAVGVIAAAVGIVLAVAVAVLVLFVRKR